MKIENKIVKSDPDLVRYCFGCGKDNPIGAKLEFIQESETEISTTFIPPKEWSGWGEIVHGGLQSVILDEISAWAVIALLSKFAVTISAKIDYFKPVYVEEELFARAKIENIENNNVYVVSTIYNSKEEKCTKGSFIFRIVDKEKVIQLSKKTLKPNKPSI